MQLEKVRRFITKNHLLNKGDTVIVAVSGGPDSLCLLHLLNRLSDEFQIRLVVAILNHGLRPEAEHEVIGVSGIAEAWSLYFETKTVDIRDYKKEHALSEEEAGRQVRYNFLFEIARKYKASTIALGHHLDDQAETVLLNLIRGTGVDGLAGILAKRYREKIKLIRPLLCLRRAEIENYCFKNGLKPFTDSSNFETAYIRNKLRLELIPHLERNFNPRIREALFGLAELAAADRLFLTSLAIKSLPTIARAGKHKIQLDVKRFMLLPPALRGRVLRLLLQRLTPGKRISRIHIEQLLFLAGTGFTGKQLTLPGGIRAHMDYGNLVIFPEIASEQRRFERQTLEVPGRVHLPGNMTIDANRIPVTEIDWPPPAYRAYLDFKKLPDSMLTVRLRSPGDRFYPQGAPGSKKLKDFLIDRKVPSFRRDYLPLVESAGEIIWVAGLRIAHPYRVTGQTEEVLLLEYKAKTARLAGKSKGNKQLLG